MTAGRPVRNASTRWGPIIQVLREGQQVVVQVVTQRGGRVTTVRHLVRDQELLQLELRGHGTQPKVHRGPWCMPPPPLEDPPPTPWVYKPEPPPPPGTKP